jgi:pantoate--beta-alanine ligase
MITTEGIDSVRDVRQQRGSEQWGFVATMGYLHEGHLSLVRKARTENDAVAVSIFVNPTQFAPGEDLAIYPRDTDRDTQLLLNENVDLLFIPPVDVIYPPGFQTSVTVNELSKPLEGRARPTHFQGVTTIMAKLLNIVQPSRAYFGQKDAQQCVVIKRMVEDLDVDVDIIMCPIVREPDGLAMSSRNVRLSPEDRSAATIIFHTLEQAAKRVIGGERSGDLLRWLMRDSLKAEPRAKIDYVSVADPATLEELSYVQDSVLLSTAVFFGGVRLIDNELLTNLS